MQTQSKIQLRQTLRDNRLKLGIKAVNLANPEILKYFVDLIPFENMETLHLYVSIAKDNEIDTFELMEYVWTNYPNIQTIVPRLNKLGEYDSVAVSRLTKWKYAGIRIPEPIDGAVLSKSTKFDVIIVPMLGFDDNGHRLGHGKGWYDRFLATQPHALKVGLCYEFGLVDGGLPNEPHDIPLDYIITEKSVRKF